MVREKRQSDASVPGNLRDVLNEAQWQALPGVKLSGWEVRFLRRPLFQDPELVIHHPDDNRTAILDKDGRIKIRASIKVRERESRVYTPAPDDPLIWTK